MWDEVPQSGTGGGRGCRRASPGLLGQAQPDGPLVPAQAAPQQPETLGFLVILSSLLMSPSARLQIEACLALEPFAAEHKIAMAQAKVIGALIALTQSSDQEVQLTAGRVLKLMG